MVLWSGSIDERHQQKIIAAESVGCQKGRLVRNLFWMTAKRKRNYTEKMLESVEIESKKLTEETIPKHTTDKNLTMES